MEALQAGCCPMPTCITAPGPGPRTALQVLQNITALLLPPFISPCKPALVPLVQLECAAKGILGSVVPAG